MPIIELTTPISAPIDRCFDLARSIDLHKLSTAGTNEEAIAGVTSSLIDIGQTVTWRATHFGIRQTLTSKITELVYPTHFRDEMIQGPFKMIRHDHHFQIAHDGTIMKDVFRFESPYGLLGRMFNSLLLEKYLKNFLVCRNQVIKHAAESDEWKIILRSPKQMS